MGKIDVKRRLSGTKGLKVGPNDARQFILRKHIKPLMSNFDARDHLNIKSKSADAREKLNKLKNKTNGVAQTKPKTTHKIRKLMSIPIKSESKVSLKQGSLTRTVKGITKVQTKLKAGTLTRTLKGNQRRPVFMKTEPKKVINSRKTQMIIKDKSPTKGIKLEIESQYPRKREPASKYVWNKPPRRAPERYVNPTYDEYSSVMQTDQRPRQPRASVIPVHMSTPYDYEEPFTGQYNDYSRPTTSIVERSYSPEYQLVRADESRQFRQFMQQQELQRTARIRDDMLELEARRRASLIDLQESRNRYYEEQQPVLSRRSTLSSFSHGYEVIVSNLIPIIHESEIESCFHQFGNVLSIDFINKSTAKVTYEHLEDAKMAVMNLDNKEVPVIFGTSYMGTKFAKQRINVKLPPSPLFGETFVSSMKPANRSFAQIQKTPSFRNVPSSFMPSRTTFTTRQAQSRPYSYNINVEPNVDSTHSALFSNRSIQHGEPTKNFLIRRM